MNMTITNRKIAFAFSNGASLLLVLLLCAVAASAQERFGEINGVATDPTGAVVPNATVTLTRAGAERVQTTTTGPEGTYVFRSLDPGIYSVRFDLAGFNPYEVSNVQLAASRVLTVNAKFEVASAGQTVEVTEAAALIDTTTPLVAQNLSSGEFDRLPKARSFQSLALTSANVTTGQLEGGIQVNGASASENQFVVDGISVNSILQGQQRQNAVFEILQEVQVKTGGIEAQYGGATGGVITAITKSGGNNFHGDLHYYFYGNPISAGPSQRLMLDPGNEITTAYVQDNKARSDNHEAGYTLGGRFIRDKLYFFSAASPQFQRRDNAYITGDPIPQRVVLTSDATYMQAFNKVSFTPVKWLAGNVSWLYSPSHQEGTLPGFDAYGNQTTDTAASLMRQQLRGWFAPQSSYNADLTFTLSPTAVLQVQGGYFWDNFKSTGLSGLSAIEWGNSSLPDAGLPFSLPSDLQRGTGSSTIPRVQNTFHDLATRAVVQANFSKFVSSFGGAHDLKIGIGRMKNVNNVDVSYPGGGYITLFWDLAYQGQRGTYGYYRLDDLATRGSTGGTIDNIFIQDRWRPVRRLSIDLGLRFEKEVVPSFRRDIADPAFEFGWTQKIAPRLGASYDVFGDGRMKLFGSWGIFQNWIPYELSRGTFGGDLWHRFYRSLDNLSDVLSLGNGNLPGKNLWPGGTYRDLRIPSFGTDQLDPNIKPLSNYLVNAGVEYQVRTNMVAAVRYTRNNLRNAIEDVGRLNEEGSEVYTYGNPGQGLVTQSAPYGNTGLVINYPRPKRQYDAVDFSIRRQFSRNWFGSVSYTWSRLYGNYSGLTSTDEPTPPSTGLGSTVSQQSGTQVARPGTSASRYYDLPYLVYDAQGNLSYGRLATDRPHSLRVWGSYSFPFGTEIGAFFYAASGTPVTTMVDTTDGGAYVYVNGRGDLGRTPVLNRTDLMIAHEIKKFGEGRSLRFELNIQNLFNQRISTLTYPFYNRFNRETSGIDLSNTDFTKPYDWQALVAATEDAASPVGAKDPRFRQADLFTTGFSGRVGVKFIF